MTTSTSPNTVLCHFVAGFGDNAPFHALARLVRRPCHLVEGLVQRQIMTNGILYTNQNACPTS